MWGSRCVNIKHAVNIHIHIQRHYTTAHDEDEDDDQNIPLI